MRMMMAAVWISALLTAGNALAAGNMLAAGNVTASGTVSGLNSYFSGVAGIGPNTSASTGSTLNVNGSISAYSAIGFNRNPNDGSLPAFGKADYGRYQITPFKNYLSITSFNANGDYTGQISMLAANGYVGIGIDVTPTSLLEVAGEARANRFVAQADAGGQAFVANARSVDNFVWAPLIYNSDASQPLGGLSFGPNNMTVHIGSGLTTVMTINNTGAMTIAGALTQNSDARLKTDIHTLPDGLEKVAALRGISFHWKDPAKDKREQVGVVAQEIQAVYPQLVTADGSGTLSVNYSGLVAPLIEAVKTLKTRNEVLEMRVARLEALISDTIPPPR